MLPGQRNTAVYAFEDVEPGPLRNLGIHDVEHEVAVLDAVLELRRQVLELLLVEIGLVGELEPQAVLDEARECREALQAIHDDHAALGVLCEVEHGQRDAHKHRLDEIALLIVVPDERSLEVGIHDERALVDAPHHVVDGSLLVTDEERVDGVVTPSLRPRPRRAPRSLRGQGSTSLNHSFADLTCYRG